MLRLTAKLCTVFTLSALLMACFHNRENDYQQTHSEPTLHRPAAYPSVNNNAYAVPESGQWSPEQPAQLYPPESLLAKQAGNNLLKATPVQMGIGHLGQPALLLRNQSLTTALANVKAALVKNGFSINGINKNTVTVSRDNNALEFLLNNSHLGTIVNVQSLDNYLSSVKSKALLADLANGLS